MTTDNKTLENRFLEAAEDGDLDTINACLKANVDVDFKNNTGWSALLYATWEGHTAALMRAARNGRQEIVSTLLAAGADTDLKNNDGRTALDIALQWGHQHIATTIQAEVEKSAFKRAEMPAPYQSKKVKL